MEVILLEKIRNLGALGDQVRVKNGYARNYLIPYGKAVIANEQNKAEFEARRAELERQQQDALARAQARAETIDGATIQMSVRASEEGKLFGSVSTRDIAEAMKAAGYEVSRSEIQLSSGPIKEVGDFEITVGLHPEVTVKVTVSVSPEA